MESFQQKINYSQEFDSTESIQSFYLKFGYVSIKDLIHKSNFNSSSLCRLVGVSNFTQSTIGDFVIRKPEEL